MSETVKILLVEDNPDEEALALLALKKSGVNKQEVAVVRDGQEAIDYLYAEGAYRERDLRRAPKVVFLDLNLPKVHGLDVLKRLRSDARTQLLPVVILTSSDEQRDITEGYRYGANSFVQKAFDFDDFIQNIKQLRTYWLDLNITPHD